MEKSYFNEWKSGELSLIDAYMFTSNLIFRIMSQGVYRGKYLDKLIYERNIMACQFVDSELLKNAFCLVRERGFREWVKVDTLSEFNIYSDRLKSLYDDY